MAFGSESNNPRERRAFAQLMIARYKNGEDVVFHDVYVAASRASKTARGARCDYGRAIGGIVANFHEINVMDNELTVIGVAPAPNGKTNGAHTNGNSHNKFSPVVLVVPLDEALDRAGNINAFPSAGRVLQTPFDEGYISLPPTSFAG